MTTKPQVLRWVLTPPPVKHEIHNGARKNFVVELKKNPNRWAQYKPGHPHRASIAYGLKHDFPGIETTCRVQPGDHEPRQFDVYARWVGE